MPEQKSNVVNDVVGVVVRNAVPIALAVVATLLVADRCHRAEYAEWEARVETVQRQAAVNLERTVEALREEQEQSQRADSIAEDVRERAVRVEERIDTVLVETPPELEDHPAIVQRDKIIEEVTDQRDDALRAFEEQKEATAILRTALEESRETVDSLSTVLEDRPSPRPWWVPEVGVGPFAGLCSDGGPCTGLGAHVSWKVSL